MGDRHESVPQGQPGDRHGISHKDSMGQDMNQSQGPPGGQTESVKDAWGPRHEQSQGQPGDQT